MSNDLAHLAGTAQLASGAPLQARRRRANDDAAPAPPDPPAGTNVRVASGPTVRDVTLTEPIPAGHKFSVRALACGLRIRKYGEFIGRLTASVPAGGWIHLHNLVTTARHETAHEHAWYDAAESPGQLRVLGTAQCHVGESPVFDASCNRLYWIDVRETPAIHVLELESGRERSWSLQEDI